MYIFDLIVCTTNNKDIRLEVNKQLDIKKINNNLIYFTLDYKIDTLLLLPFSMNSILYYSAYDFEKYIYCTYLMYLKVNNVKQCYLKYLIFISQIYNNPNLCAPYLIYLEICKNGPISENISTLLYFIFYANNYEITCNTPYLYYLKIINTKLKRLYLKSKYVLSLDIREKTNVVN